MARLRAQQIEGVRCITGGLLQTPVVSQALRAQNRSLKLKAQRTAFTQGAGYVDKALYGAVELGEMVE